MSSDIKRRTFIKKSITAGLILTAAPAVLRGNDDRRVRLGFIGVGGRGTGLLKTTLRLEEVDVPSVCDIAPKNLKTAQNIVEEAKGTRPEGYGDHAFSYLKMLERDDLDGVVICTPWELHIPMAG